MLKYSFCTGIYLIFLVHPFEEALFLDAFLILHQLDVPSTVRFPLELDPVMYMLPISAVMNFRSFSFFSFELIHCFFSD